MINFEERYPENPKDDSKDKKSSEVRQHVADVQTEVPADESKEIKKELQEELSGEEGDKKESNKEKKGEQNEEKKNTAPSSDDIVGKESIGTRKHTASVGVGLAELAGKTDKESFQEVVESKDRPPEKLQEELAKANIKHEQKPGPTKISDFEVINQDHGLKPYEHDIRARVNLFKSWMKKFDDSEGGLLGLAESYKKFGVNKVEGGIMYREWAPSARRVCLCGDFNSWNRDTHACNRNQYGVWELFIPDLPDGTPAIKHRSKVKASLVLCDGTRVCFFNNKNRQTEILLGYVMLPRTKEALPMMESFGIHLNLTNGSTNILRNIRKLIVYMSVMLE